eukprot:11077683-Alexandrium_andersonii.AAC.1
MAPPKARSSSESGSPGASGEWKTAQGRRTGQQRKQPPESATAGVTAAAKPPEGTGGGPSSGFARQGA